MPRKTTLDPLGGAAGNRFFAEGLREARKRWKVAGAVPGKIDATQRFSDAGTVAGTPPAQGCSSLSQSSVRTPFVSTFCGRRNWDDDWDDRSQSSSYLER